MIQALLMFLVVQFFIFAGFPIYISCIATGIIFIITEGIPFGVVIIKMFGTINSLSFLAIPFFILAGNVMTRSRITDKLVSFASAAVGQFKGGLGHVNILASVFFGGIQGSGAADAAAIGGIMIPAMEKQGYGKDYAVAVTAGSSMISPIIPPSIAFILYSCYTETPVGRLFMGGLIPGILVAIAQMIVNGIEYRRRGYNFETGKFSIINLAKAFLDSIGALIMPCIIIGGILFGLVTPTESGVLAVLYGLIYGFFISKRLKIKDLPGILMDTAVTTTVVMLTVAATGILSYLLVSWRFEHMIYDFAINTLQNRYLVSFFLMLVLLLLGIFLEPPVLIAMFATSVLAIGNTLGFDPVHYGVMMVIIMQLGAITPPVGTFLFIACGVAKLPLEKSVKPLMPYMLVIVLVVVLMLFIPPLVTFMPSLIMGN
jgi:C4-dicarboxylate transporter DctM subunit